MTIRGPDGLPIDPDVAPADLAAFRPVRRSARTHLEVLFAIALGGALGAPARYGVAQLVHVAPDSFPWATFWTNVSGSFALGLVLILVLERFPPTRYVRPFLATGFLGAYTTYSTFAVETDLLAKNGHVGIALTYAIGESVRRVHRGVGRNRARSHHPARQRRPPMKLEGNQKRLTIFIGESDRHGHTPLATEIVHRAHAAGLAGASVFRGVEGYGASNHIHTTRILSLSDDLPMAITIIDSDERISAFLPQLDDLISEGLVIVEDVEVIKYVGRPAPEGRS